jgi:hypothetical protein
MPPPPSLKQKVPKALTTGISDSSTPTTKMRKPNDEQKTKKLNTRAQQNAVLGTAQKKMLKLKPSKKLRIQNKKRRKLSAEPTNLPPKNPTNKLFAPASERATPTKN